MNESLEASRLEVFQNRVLNNTWLKHKPIITADGRSPQTVFLCLLHDVFEALYGGAAGGGKSEALFMAALMFVDVPNYNAIIFRRSFTDLCKPGALIDRSFQWLTGTGARWDGVNHTWVFPSGAKVAFGFLENDRDVYHHQSAEYQFIGFDELTQFTEFQYRYMLSRARRLQGVDLPIRIRSATNPPNRLQTGEVKGKIIEYAWWLKKDVKSESTILGRTKILSILTKRGANLYDPESIKDAIAKQPWSNGRKNNACDAYSSFLKMTKGTWEAPVYITIRKLPFIPKETEIDQLIAGSSKRMATFLQMLKETGARCGEIWQLKWDDVDFESKVVNITPEKNSNPRVTHLSDKLLDMLRQLPKNYAENVFAFPTMRIDNHAVTFQQQRRRIANKIGNPRIMKIHFHTLRHFKGTMLYHKTKDLL